MFSFKEINTFLQKLKSNEWVVNCAINLTVRKTKQWMFAIKRKMRTEKNRSLCGSFAFREALSPLMLCAPKALAKQTRKSTQVLDLRSTCVSFGHPLASTCHDLRGLALTLVELKFGRKQTQVLHDGLLKRKCHLRLEEAV